MLEKPLDVLQQFPVRKSGKQKRAFLDAVQAYTNELGYASAIEKGSLGSKNLVIGDPDGAEYLVTAHYDTCARLPFPNLITPCNFWAFFAYQLFTVAYMFAAILVVALITMLVTNNEEITFYVSYLALWVFLILMMVGPANQHNTNDNTSGVVSVLEIAGALPEEHRGKACFVLFDLEEAGLIGSSSYFARHKKAAKDQLVLNLDCVGDGDTLMLFPTAKLKKDAVKMAALERICGDCDGKTLVLRKRGFSVYPSDQRNFPLGVGIAAFRSSWAGLYLSRIHTPKDTVLEQQNVTILRERLIALITGSAVQ